MSTFLKAKLSASLWLAVAAPAVAARDPKPAKLRATSVATLRAQDSIAAPQSLTTPQFAPGGFSRDSKQLLLSVSELGVRMGSGAAREAWSYLRSVDLKTGAILTLAKIRGDMDWSSVPPDNGSAGLHKAAAAHVAAAQVPQLPSALRATPVAMLWAQDSEVIERSFIQPQFQPLRIPRDGRFLTIQAEEAKPLEGIVYSTLRSLQAVDVLTGRATVLSRFQRASGFDWAEESLGNSAAPRFPSTANEPGSAEPWITLGKPSDQPPPHDVLKVFTPGDLRGKMVYVAFVRVSGTGDQSQWRTFLVLRHAGKRAGTVQTYSVQLRAGDLFSPQWSPNGKMVMLKVGNAGDSTNVYLIHVWNPQTGQLRQGPPEYVSHLLPRWSPDSGRIAYIVGGDIAGRVFYRDKPISLHVHDLKTGQSRVVASGIPNGFYTPADFAWAGTNTLLYTLPPQPLALTQRHSAPAPARQDSRRDSTEPLRPSIYKVSTTGGASRLLVRGAYKPTPSPAGRWIAFLGWPQADEVARSRTGAKGTQPRNADTDSGPKLFLLDQATRRRIQVGLDFLGPDTQLLWAPDGQRLIIIDTRYNMDTARGTASISMVSTEDAAKLLAKSS